MTTPAAAPSPSPSSSPSPRSSFGMAAHPRSAMLTQLGLVFLVAGFLGHVLAARAIGGSYIAWRDHLAGFVMATVVSWVVLMLIGRLAWRGRSDITLFIVGVLQLALGVFVYLTRYHVHG